MPWRDEVLLSPAQLGAESSSSSTAVPRAPRQPFSMCPRRETPASSRDTPVQLYKITLQGRRVGKWRTAIHPPSDRAWFTLLCRGFVFFYPRLDHGNGGCMWKRHPARQLCGSRRCWSACPRSCEDPTWKPWSLFLFSASASPFPPSSPKVLLIPSVNVKLR